MAYTLYRDDMGQVYIADPAIAPAAWLARRTAIKLSELDGDLDGISDGTTYRRAKQYIGYITQNATADVEYVIGFEPRSFIFRGFLGHDTLFSRDSFGFDDTVSHYCVSDITYSASMSIKLMEDAGNYIEAYVLSTTATSFTLRWAKTGAPTHAAQVVYCAMRS